MVSGNRTTSDVWVIKTDLNGTLLWERSFGGSGLDWGHSVVELVSGDLMVAAVTSSGDGDVEKNYGASDILLIRITRDGTPVWKKTYGGSFSDNVWKLDPSPGGGAYFVGDSYSVDGHFTGNHGESDLLIGEVDGDGNMLWHRQVGGSSVDRGSWVKSTSSGTLIITGMTASSDGDVSGDHSSGDLWILEVEGNRNESDSMPVQEVERPVTKEPAIGPLGGDGPVPTDPDGDGRYEDLNGNGILDLQDPAVFFKYFNWLQSQGYVYAFDFNENGILDLGDVQALFMKVQS
jgi:PKD repeat protein